MAHYWCDEGGIAEVAKPVSEGGESCLFYLVRIVALGLAKGRRDTQAAVQATWDEVLQPLSCCRRW